MIWTAWRTERLLLVVSLGVVALVAIWLTVTGALQEAAWNAFASLNCAQPGSSATCMAAASRYYNATHFSTANVGLVMAVPAILGLVLGAPIVAREIEQRTNRLAWTQSISRTRWLLVKLGVGALATVAMVGALCPLLEWWTTAAQRGDRVVPDNFDISGFVPVAYALFAFMLGAALGAVIRRTGWTFAVGVPVFAALRLATRVYVRPDLVAPVSVVSNPDDTYATSAAWLLNQGYVPIGRLSPAAGQNWQSGTGVVYNCMPGSGFVSNDSKTVHSLAYCAAKFRMHFVLQYQPGSHFWALQAGESAIFLAASAVLLAMTVLAVRRWRT